MSFETSFNTTMTFEVGPWFNPADSETQAGLCGTSAQRRKTGYVNIDGDGGKETKFGISSAAHPTIDIKSLTLAHAMDIYRADYWLPISGDKLPDKLGLLVFDAAVNHGVVQSIKFLQQAAGVRVDGALGPITLSKATDDLAPRLLSIREQFFREIVTRKPSQQKFLAGWLNRVNSLRKLTC